MNNIFLNTLNGEVEKRPPVWFMRQAGRILPSYRKLKESHKFYDMMKNAEMTSKVTLLPITDLDVDAAILFSDILVIPDALGMDLIFTENGPKFANVVRYMAVGISPIKSSFEKQPESIDQTAKSLGLKTVKILNKIYIPINRPAIIIAFLLCFVDITKDLPLTLILRPFNFDTLATQTYEFAVEEMLARSSLYSFAIVFLGTVMLIILKNTLNKDIDVS